MPKASWNDVVIADSDHVETVEGNAYYPPDTVRREFLVKSEHTTRCPWKGTANYYHVVVNGKENRDAAWYYPEPKDAAANIKDHVAFWKGIKEG